MKVPWADERCVLCLGTPKADDPETVRSEAHVIPSSIGGKLSACLLCKRCNGRMGQFEAILPHDISVRFLRDQLEDQLPTKISSKIRHQQSYFTDHPTFGRVEARMSKKGELPRRVLGNLKDDDNALDWSGVTFKASLTDQVAPLSISVGIAYLYLALCVGARVYDPILQPVRDALLSALKGNLKAADAYSGNRHGTRIVEPIHTLLAKPDGDDAVVIFKVFGDLVWPARFPGVTNPERTLYTLNVATGEELWKSKAPS
jgi:hypothetical protein